MPIDVARDRDGESGEGTWGDIRLSAFRRVKPQEFDEADEPSLTEIGAYGKLARKDTQLLAKPDEGSVGFTQHISSRVVFTNSILLPAVLTGRGLIGPSG